MPDYIKTGKIFIMPDIILISKNEEFKNLLSPYKPKIIEFLDNDFLENDADIIILDTEIENSKLILMELIAKNLSKEYEIIILINNPSMILVSRKQT